MKASTTDMCNKMHNLMKEGIPLRAKQLAEKCGMSVGSVYITIRKMKLVHNIPVQPTKYGYLLAEHATKQDDVWLLRRANGRHTMDSITMHLCQTAIVKRWKGIEHQEMLSICESFSSRMVRLNKQSAILLQKSGKF